jgi:quercetin 2,3-dioxygenase
MTAEVDVRRAGERAATRLGWLDSKHIFSFGRRYDPAEILLWEMHAALAA